MIKKCRGAGCENKVYVDDGLVSRKGIKSVGGYCVDCKREMSAKRRRARQIRDGFRRS